MKSGPAWTCNREQIFAPIRLTTVIEEITADLRDMFSKRLALAQALAAENLSILPVGESRLARFRHAIWPQVERVLWWTPACWGRHCGTRQRRSQMRPDPQHGCHLRCGHRRHAEGHRGRGEDGPRTRLRRGGPARRGLEAGGRGHYNSTGAAVPMNASASSGKDQLDGLDQFLRSRNVTVGHGRDISALQKRPKLSGKPPRSIFKRVAQTPG